MGTLLKGIVFILIVAGVGVYSYIIGVESTRSSAVSEVYNQYNHMTIYEDGSYMGETVSGIPVVGCLEGALCDN